jgi:hypothetical protein
MLADDELPICLRVWGVPCSSAIFSGRKPSTEFVRIGLAQRLNDMWNGWNAKAISARDVYRRVPVLCHFSNFVEERGVPSLEQAALLV